MDHIRKHNTTAAVTLPVVSHNICPTSTSAQTQFNFEETLSNNTLIKENYVSPPQISFEKSNLACQTLSLLGVSSSTTLLNSLNLNNHSANCENTPTTTVLSITDQKTGLLEIE